MIVLTTALIALAGSAILAAATPRSAPVRVRVKDRRR